MSAHHTLISNLQIFSKYIEHIDAFPAAKPSGVETFLILSDKGKTFDVKVEGALVKHAVFDSTGAGECSLHHCSELFSFVSSGRKRPGGIVVIALGEKEGPVLLKLLMGSYLMKRRALTLEQTKVLIYNRSGKRVQMTDAECDVLASWKENAKDPNLNQLVKGLFSGGGDGGAAVAKPSEDKDEAAAKKKAEEEAAAKKRAEEEAAAAAAAAADAKKKAEEEAAAAAKKKAEEEAAGADAKKKAEEEAAAADAKTKADEEAAAKKKAEEDAAAIAKNDADEAAKKKKKEDDAAQKKKDEEAEKKKEDEEFAAAEAAAMEAKKREAEKSTKSKGGKSAKSPRKEDLTSSQKTSMFSRLKKKMTKKKSEPATSNRSSIKLKKLEAQKEEKEASNPKEIIEVTSYEDLPKEFQNKVKDAKIPMHLIVEHFFFLLNVLHFQSKRVFQYHNTVTNQTQITATSPGDPVEVKEAPMDFEKEEAELLNHTGVATKMYKLGREMGKGGFGSVFAGTSRDKAKTKVAIKVLKHERSKLKKYNLKEIRFLKEFPHENIVQYYDAFRNTNKDKVELWIIMEMMSGGTLTEAVKAHQFTEPQMAYVAKGILTAIAYLHENDVVHRDLKSANVMLTVEGYVKIIDFGLCCRVNDGPKLHMVGSPFWMPPEMIRRQPHSFPADIWSFAICMLELANNEIPDRRSGLYAMFVHACVGIESPFDDPELFSDAMQAFYDSALRVDPSERGTAKELLAHEWIEKAATHSSMKKVLSKVFVNNALDMLDLGGGF